MPQGPYNRTGRRACSWIMGLLLAVLLGGSPVFAAWTAPDAIAAPERTATVRVEGRGADEREAREDAYRNAAEQAAGTYVRAETRTENYQVVSDRIKTSAEAFITASQVVKSRRDPDGMVVLTMEVSVSLGKIVDDLQALKILTERMGNPTFMVIDDHRAAANRNDAEATAAAVGAVHRLLSQRLLTVVDQAQVEQLKADDAEASGSESAAMRIARKLHADVYVTVYGHVERSASVNVRFFESATGRILGEDSAYSRATDRYLADQKQAVEVAITAATGKAFETMLTYWRRDTDQGRQVPIIVNGLDFAQKSRFRKILLGLSRDVKQLNATEGHAEFVIWTDRSVEDLSEAIFEQAKAAKLGGSGESAPMQRGNRLIFNFKR